jgi:hypothetical protein
LTKDEEPCYSCKSDVFSGYSNWVLDGTIEKKSDAVDPEHYKNHPSGVECIQIVQEMPFNIGAAMKYLWRCDLKHPSPVEDLKKAKQYIDFEITRRSLC